MRLVQYSVSHKKGGIGGIEVFLQRPVAPCVEVPVKYILRRFSYFKGKFLKGLHVEQAGGFDLGHLFKLLGQGQQLPVIGERLVMDVHITVFPDGEQAVDILVLRLSGWFEPHISPHLGEQPGIPLGCRIHGNVKFRFEAVDEFCREETGGNIPALSVPAR